jgi:Rrf2 family transcriptional regulator, iron-sulfur cluster assembly transcription factor
VKLVPTRRTDYAIRALVFLANAEESPVKAGAVGKAMGIPTGFLQQVLRALLGTGIVTSRPGPAGGFALGRPADQITILQIVEAMEGPLRTSECALRGGPCHWDDVCALHRVWSSARGALCGQLDEATLAEVAADDRALAAGALAVPTDSHRRPPGG